MNEEEILRLQEQYKTTMENWLRNKTILYKWRNDGTEYNFSNNVIVPFYDYKLKRIDYAYALADNGNMICFNNARRIYVVAYGDHMDENGYYDVNINSSYTRGNGNYHIKIHRAVAFSFLYAMRIGEDIGKGNKIWVYGNLDLNNFEEQRWQVDHRNGNRHDNRAKNFCIMPQRINLKLAEYDQIIKHGKPIEKEYTEEDFEKKSADELLYDTFEWKFLEEIMKVYPEGGYEYVYTESVTHDLMLRHNIYHSDVPQKENKYVDKAWITWIIKHTAQDYRIFTGNETEQDKAEWCPHIKDPSRRKYQKYLELVCDWKTIIGKNFAEDYLQEEIILLEDKVEKEDYVYDETHVWDSDLLKELIAEFKETMEDQVDMNFSDEDFGKQIDEIRYKYVDKGIIKEA